jgi:hypothetical protein
MGLGNCMAIMDQSHLGAFCEEKAMGWVGGFRL